MGRPVVAAESKAGVERALTFVLTAAAVVMAVAVSAAEVRRLFHPGARSTIVREPTFFDGWNAIEGTFRLQGESTAPVRLVEFSDLECPACRMYHQSTLPRLVERFGDSLSVEISHLPLPGHRFAVAAARAAVCAAAQGRTSEFVEHVFKAQDSIGLKSWTSFAVAAGMKDTAEFMRCSASQSTASAVERSISVASRLGVVATPTLMVNGWVLGNDPDELARVISATLAARNPYPDTPPGSVRRLGR